MKTFMSKVADWLFGRPVWADQGILSKVEFERKVQEQEYRRRQIEAEVRPWLRV